VEGGGTDLRCREVCRRMRIEIDSMVDKNYEGFKALFSSLEIRVEVLNYSNTSRSRNCSKAHGERSTDVLVKCHSNRNA
jgi:hypothetical protein